MTTTQEPSKTMSIAGLFLENVNGEEVKVKWGETGPIMVGKDKLQHPLIIKPEYPGHGFCLYTLEVLPDDQAEVNGIQVTFTPKIANPGRHPSTAVIGPHAGTKPVLDTGFTYIVQATVPLQPATKSNGHQNGKKGGFLGGLFGRH